MSEQAITIRLVCCVNTPQVFANRLMASPCVAQGRVPLSAYFTCTDAAQGFNAAMATCNSESWLVWVHQDVFLPEGWDTQFCAALAQAQQQFPNLAIAGVYGLSGSGSAARRAGHVLDRGQLLHETATLPCLADSLDELLFAVRADSGLRMDAALGFDFYATDLVLQAQALGLPSAVVDAYCEHWSETPSRGPVAPAVSERIALSANVFEHKWAARLPITTPCFHIDKPGDVAAFLQTLERTAT